jgi:hypothetical protein
MILIACAVAIIASFLIGLFVRWGARSASRNLAEVLGEPVGYFFSGILYSIALSITPSLAIGFGNHKFTTYAGGYSSNQAARIMFLAFMISSCIYLVLAWLSSMRQKNVVFMFSLSLICTTASLYFVNRLGWSHLNGLESIVMWTQMICYTVIQVFAAQAHKEFTKPC